MNSGSRSTPEPSKPSREDTVEILWKGPLKEDDREAQISVVEDFVSRGVSGIVLAPLDDAALRQPVANAKRAGIAVVIIDSDLKGEDFVSFVATDNYRGGTLAGEHLIKALNGKGTRRDAPLPGRFRQHHQSRAGVPGRDREGPRDPRRQPEPVCGGDDRDGVQVEREPACSPQDRSGKLSVDAIFTPNESSTFGMLRALQDGGFAGKVRFVGFDSSPKLVEALKSGQIEALVMQNPFHMGYLGVKTMVAHLKGRTVEKRIDTGAILVSRENMDLPEIRSLLQPDLSQWLQ